MKGSPSNVIAGCFAMAAFAVAIIAGLAAGNSALSVLIRALIALVICYPIGLALGLICEHVVRAENSRFSDDHPVPESDLTAAPAAEAPAEADEEPLVV